MSYVDQLQALVQAAVQEVAQAVQLVLESFVVMEALAIVKMDVASFVQIQIWE